MADNGIGKAKITTVFDKDQTARAADEAITPAIKQVAQKGAQLLAGGVVGAKLFEAAKVGIEEVSDSQKIAAQTSVLLRNETGVTAGEIDKLGQSMLDLAGFDDEAARSAANVILRFGAIHDDKTLERVENDAADLAVSLGEDLPAAAQTLGQALASPDKASRLLRSAIGALSAEQQKSIKDFEATGNAAAAQDVILTALEDRIGGAAKAYGDTLPAGISRAEEEIKNAKASLVEELAPALEKGADLVGSFAVGVENLPDPLRLAAAGTVAVGTAVFGIGQPLAGLVVSLKQLQAAREANAIATRANATATEAEATATTTAAASTATKVAAQDAELAAAESLFATEGGLVALNSELTGTEAEVAAATAARTATMIELATAEGEAALATAGLTAETEALVVVEEEQAGSALLAALGPVGAVAGVAAIGMALFASSEGDASHASEALSGTIGKLDDNFSQLGTSSKVDISTFVHDLVAAKKGGDEYASVLNKLHVTTEDYATAAAHGTGAVADLIKAHEKDADLSRTDKINLILLTGQIDESAHAAVNAAEAQGRFTQAQVEAATAANTAADGTVNYAGVLDSLGGAAGGTATAVGEVSTAVLGVDGELRTVGDNQAFADQTERAQKLAAELDVAKQKFQEVVQAQRGLLSAGVRAETGQANIDAANQRVADAKKAATTGVADNSAELGRGVRDAKERLADAKASAAAAKTPEEQARAQRGVRDATEGLTAAQKKQADSAGDAKKAQDTYNQAVRDAEIAVNDQADALTQLHEQQIVANGGVADADGGLAFYEATLNGLAANLSTGDVHNALEAHITDLDNVREAAIEAAIAEHILDPSAPDSGFKEGRRGTNGNRAFASGGEVRPFETFRGAENGFEILASDGLFQAPASGGRVLNNPESIKALSGLGGNTVHQPITINAVNVDDGMHRALAEAAWRAQAA